MDEREKKKVIYTLLIGFFGIVLLKFTFDYFWSRGIYNRAFNGEVVSFGKSRDTKVLYVNLSDDSRVYLGNYFKRHENPQKGDTLIKRKKSFKVYIKRKGKILDSFNHDYSDAFVSRLFFK